jgi:hypothetical protein
MNGVPMDAPRSERRKDSDRKPMIDLDAMDQAAELEIARKAELKEKEKSRLEHQMKLEASGPAPKPGKATQAESVLVGAIVAKPAALKLRPRPRRVVTVWVFAPGAPVRREAPSHRLSYHARHSVSPATAMGIVVGSPSVD